MSFFKFFFTLLLAAGVTGFRSASQANVHAKVPSSCVQLDSAQKSVQAFLTQYQNLLLSEVDDLSTFQLDKQDANNYLSPDKISQIVASLKWKALPMEYQSDRFLEGACGNHNTGCWAWITVRCNGDIWVNVDGAD
jgi:hypothetical protein